MRTATALAHIFLFISLFLESKADTNVTVEDAQIAWPSSWGSDTNITSCSSLAGIHYSYLANTSVSYEFNGTAIYMRVIRDYFIGTYAVSIDGGPPQVFDGYSPTHSCDIQFGSTGLSLGPHTITATFNGRSPQNSILASTLFSFLMVTAFIYTLPDSSPSKTSSSLTAATQSFMPHKSPLKTSAIPGLVVGIFVFLAALATLFYFRRRNNFRSHNRSLPRIDTTARPFVGNEPAVPNMSSLPHEPRPSPRPRKDGLREPDIISPASFIRPSPASSQATPIEPGSAVAQYIVQNLGSASSAHTSSHVLTFTSVTAGENVYDAPPQYEAANLHSPRV